MSADPAAVETLGQLLMRDHGCILHNGQNPEARPCRACTRRARLIVDEWLPDVLTATKRVALLDAARFFEYQMAPAWGGSARWFSTGARVADLVGEILRERADAALDRAEGDA